MFHGCSQKLARQTMSVEDRRRNVQMVGLFMVIVVVCRLRARAPQPPDGVAGRHQPRESVTSHSRERYARIITPRSTSPARTRTEHPPSAHHTTRKHGNKEPDKEQTRSTGYKVTGNPDQKDPISTTSKRRLRCLRLRYN